MFYEVIGALVRASSKPVSELNPQGDEVDLFHARRISQMLERIGGAWPHLMSAVSRENRILAAAIGDEVDADGDPVAENRRLLVLVDQAIATTDDPELRLRLRGALAEAAKEQRAALRAGR